MKTIVCDREDFMLNSLLNWKPVKLIQGWSNVIRLPCSADNSSSCILDMLKFLQLSFGDAPQAAVGIVQSG